MVDNKEQWNNEEIYSQENINEQDYYDDSSAEEYESDDAQEYESYDDDYVQEEGNQRQPQKKNPLLKFILFLFVLAGIVILAVTKLGIGKNMTAENPAPVVPETQSETAVPAGSDSQTTENDDFLNNDSQNSDMVNVDFNESGSTNVKTDENSDTVATVTETNDSTADLFSGDKQSASASKENNSIMVSYNKLARLNPFKPPVSASEQASRKAAPGYTTVGNVPFEIVEPPTSSVPDENLTKLLSTQISGIMYDSVSPSAIVNINGTDQFVKVGDSVGGYKIVAITKDKVQIKYQNNSYVASVGQLFSKGSLEQNDVSDLEHKFAGRYKNK